MPAACKTGTTSDYVDGWLCGYTPYYTTAVWVGMDVYKSVDDLKGNTYPAYIWKNYMDKIHQDLERKEFSYYIGQEEDKTTATTEEDVDMEDNQGEEMQIPDSLETEDDRKEDQENQGNTDREDENTPDKDTPDYGDEDKNEPEDDGQNDNKEDQEGGDAQGDHGEDSVLPGDDLPEEE